MSFIPEDEVQGKRAVSLAPMIDFLFLMLMFFASLAVSRVTTRETDINLVEIKPETRGSITESSADYKLVHITISADGSYKWVTEIHDYVMDTAEAIAQELTTQHRKGLLPQNQEETQVMLRIDRTAQWEPILKVIFAIREAGFDVHPIYEPVQEASDQSLIAGG